MSTYFKAMSVLGCETDRLRSRSVCKHNCCDGKNCVSWLSEKFQELQAFEDTNLTPDEITEHEEMFKAYRHVCGGKSPDEIAAMQAELAQYKAQQWISVEERLPEHTDEYNVFCNIGSMLGGYEDVRTYRYERIRGKEPKWCIPDCFDEVVCITHWRPLPEPPEKGTEK